MRVGILTGGTADPAFIREYTEKKPVDAWIGVDRGLETLRMLGVIPGTIVGDFDSVSPEVLNFYRSQPGIDWHVFRPEKDDTDTELAIRQALDAGADSITLFGGTGSRIDHVLGTIHVMKRALDAGIPCEMVDPHNRITLAEGSRTFRKEELFGPYVSFLPFAGPVSGVTLSGFRYPLWDARILPGSSLTISNELSEEEGTLRIGRGILICMEARD